jgi:hypothetical protein
MEIDMPVRTASCNCGVIRIEARGQPVRIGLCYCGCKPAAAVMAHAAEEGETNHRPLAKL